VGLPSPAAPYPYPYFLVPEAERPSRCVLTADQCVVDGKEFYVRASLAIHVHEAESPLLYGVWVSLSGEHYRRFSASFDDRSRQAGESYFGWLCTPLMGYPDTLLLKTYVHVQPWPERPLVELEPTTHPLSVDYHHGVSIERALELVAPYVARAERV
jgi:hypothetical protein